MDLSLLISLGRFALVLGGMIFVHELGHFLVAKWRGIYVYCFSLGFGPKLLGFRRGETEYRLSLIPLGGYVKMAGQEDIPEKERLDRETQDIPPERSYLNKKTWEKVAVIAAGPLMNILSACLIFTALYSLGFQEPSYLSDARVGWVEESSPAAEAGISVGDRILTIAGKRMEGWEDVLIAVVLSGGNPLELEIESGNLVRKLKVTPAYLNKSPYPVLGIQPYSEATIEEVIPGSPAAAAGLKPGDWLRSLDGEDVSFPLLLDLVAQKGGEEVSLGVVREGRELTVSLRPQRVGQLPGAIVLGGEVFATGDDPDLPWQEGEKLTAIDGENVSPDQAEKIIAADPGREMILSLRGAAGKSRELRVTTVPRGRLGVKLTLRKVRKQVALPAALIRGVVQTWRQTRLWVIEMAALISGKVSPRGLGGPILIYQLTEDAAREGWAVLAQFVAKVCIILGMVNLIPIPILDGGHILIALIEGVRGRRLSEKTLAALQYAGLAIIAGLFLLIFYNDIVYRLLGKN